VILKDLATSLNLTNLTPELAAEESYDVSAGHVSDLLSDVLAHAPAGGLLVTIQVHLNVIAVAVHAGLVAVVFAGGMTPEEAVREKAVEERVLLYSFPRSAFDLVGKLYSMGVRGAHA